MEAIIGHIRKDTWTQKLVASKLFWLLICSSLFAYPIYRSLNRTLPPPLPIYSKLPSFSLINEFNKPFGSKDLLGKIYFVTFLSTKAAYLDDGLMKKLVKIQKRMRGVKQDAAMITISTGPAADTTEVLHEFARKYQTNPFYWNFLSGEKAEVSSLVDHAFKKIMVENKIINEASLAMNGGQLEKVVLVDRVGQVRGFYSLDKHSVNKMMIDVGLLINRSK